MVQETAQKALVGYEEKTEDLKETKSWISEDERQQVLDRIKEIREWLDEQLKAQSALQLYEDPVYKSQEVITKLQGLKKLFGKVSSKKKPRPPKPAKNETIEVTNSTEGANSTDGNRANETTTEEDEKQKLEMENEEKGSENEEQKSEESSEEEKKEEL